MSKDATFFNEKVGCADMRRPAQDSALKENI